MAVIPATITIIAVLTVVAVAVAVHQITRRLERLEAQEAAAMQSTQ